MAQCAVLIYARDSAHAPDATPQDTASSDRYSDQLVQSGSTARVARDLDLAESACRRRTPRLWRGGVGAGIPDNPDAWLTTTAKRRAIDAIRRDTALRSKLPLLVEPEEAAEEVAMHELTAQDAGDPDDAVPDERLRLIFTCCHPALGQDAQVARTLRLVPGAPPASADWSSTTRRTGGRRETRWRSATWWSAPAVATATAGAPAASRRRRR
jgi:hypothetical protein